ncbi:MAG TPA: biopolymer transporter ExbD [Cyanobacteria bacterium UBA11149]|nr:biopolymer transporter ExbD [Cyanobacteria bacterium UBA11367]HBE58540.1 biopolymer transporter ExbD [Cyanobacteria bacterium UBA11366]HBK62131.1 biopolymer transporter ExbD [Cyanobacteria bacterium UBA11166]HBR72247.1 biopolymer transporter ExbD [Cyanobacteria bacterium UBA11159]HBS72018.1 biopolymer transporter ExbD [Cyanobacteria bacterium UBA11153]HBW91692.1 biopolymer transporter ExbD [Cyanobacteria bacterium UBA11149]HCA95715.1 biopolymer transporter ExbD [Cyanobacteria bacterium UBA
MKKKSRLSLASLAPRPLRLRIDTQPEEVRIEIVPLIDVIFCILTFFILAAVGFARQQAINVDLPKASSGTPQGQQIIMVSVNDLGQVFVEKEPVVTKDELKAKLQAHTPQNYQPLIALYASPSVNYNDVVQVLDVLKEVGGSRVALATLPKAAPQTPNPNAPNPNAPNPNAPNPNPYVPPTGVPGYTPAPGQIPTNPDGINPYPQQQLPSGVTPGQSQIPLPGNQPSGVIPGQLPAN